jgi:hypothetical protein
MTRARFERYFSVNIWDQEMKVEGGLAAHLSHTRMTLSKEEITWLESSALDHSAALPVDVNLVHLQIIVEF